MCSDIQQIDIEHVSALAICAPHIYVVHANATNTTNNVIQTCLIFLKFYHDDDNNCTTTTAKKTFIEQKLLMTWLHFIAILEIVLFGASTLGRD